MSTAATRPHHPSSVAMEGKQKTKTNLMEDLFLKETAKSGQPRGRARQEVVLRKCM